LYADEQIECREKNLGLLNSNNLTVKNSNVTLTVSATASLYLTILSLKKKNIKRFLVFTPVYYTILDTLKDIDAQIVYFPLIDKENFSVNFSKLEEIIIDQEIEAIFFVDPIYSGGIEILNETYRFLSEISVRKNIWLICDYTLGGLEWNKKTFDPFPYEKLKELFKSERFIFIDSVSKRLLINGLKISTVIGSPEIISEIENYASQVYGGFSAPQIEFLNDIYSLKNTAELSLMIKSNVDVMKNNYELLNSMLIGTQYNLYRANSAYFTMIAHKEKSTEEVNAKNIIKNFLFEENMLAFPSFHFSFHPSNKFAFRVNVFRDLSTAMSPLESCIRKDVK
jgi:aspartate/methionine/tyrosine aminotransferase